MTLPLDASAPPDGTAWLDGALLPAAATAVPISDRGLLLGEGLFETLLAWEGAVLEADAHLARLSRSARALALPLTWSAAELGAAFTALLEANDLQRGRAVLRLTLTGGDGPRGLLPPASPQPRLLITARPAAEAPVDPATVVIAPFAVAAASPLRGHKTLSALEQVLARRHAAAAGADEALLLNTAGHLVEASAANLFLVRGGRLLTPPLADGALPGVTRARVLALASEAGIPATADRSLTAADLAAADEAFLTNSLIGLRPVGSAAGRILGVGPLTAKLRDALRRCWQDKAPTRFSG
ncbi:MAG: aminotransferase class IV [Ardenticatenia bacterium]|nr:aminotransferase class IV [Ardenticatenia bacterium]